MAKTMTILAGDLPLGEFKVKHGEIIFPGGAWPKFEERTPISNIVKAVPLDEQGKKSFVRAALASTAGALLLGPAGLLAGALAAGSSKRVTFSAMLADGRRFVAETDGDTFRVIAANAAMSG